MDTITIHADQVTVHLHSATPTPSASVVTTPILVDVDTKSLADAVRAAVPASTTTARFTSVYADGTQGDSDSTRTDHVAVIDHLHGLMWSVESMGNPADADEGIPQAKCIERCRELRLLGYDDWRLPTRAELASLIDDTRHEPAIDTQLFPGVKSRWHWTSTPCAWSSASAWFVYFDYGHVSYGHRLSNGFALAVRRVGQ